MTHLGRHVAGVKGQVAMAAARTVKEEYEFDFRSFLYILNS